MDQSPPSDLVEPPDLVEDHVDATEDTSAPAPSVSWWRTWWAAAAAGLALLVVVSAVALVSTQRSSDRARDQLADAGVAGAQTQADLDQAAHDLDAQRAQLASVLAKAKAVGDQLSSQTAARDQQQAVVDKARSDLTTLSGVLNSQQLVVYVQAKHLNELSDCINSANQALNIMSFGDRDAGTKLLQDSSAKCDAVNAYLAGLGQTPGTGGP
jgi:hypothetical protein